MGRTGPARRARVGPGQHAGRGAGPQRAGAPLRVGTGLHVPGVHNVARAQHPTPAALREGRFNDNSCFLLLDQTVIGSQALVRLLERILDARCAADHIYENKPIISRPWSS